jgi:hypothetical protein
MKTRTSFVSNSSSSSFVIPSNEMMEVVPASVRGHTVEALTGSLEQLISDLQRLNNATAAEHMPEIGSYINTTIYVCRTYKEKLKKHSQGSWITELLDDGWAWEQGLNDYPVFQER